MYTQEVYNFFKELSEAEFDARFLALSKTSEFSAFASGVGTPQDVTVISEGLIGVGVEEKWCVDPTAFRTIIKCITTRIMQRLIT